jgi:hypothetical protein
VPRTGRAPPPPAPLHALLQVLLRVGFLARRTQGTPRSGAAAAAAAGATSITAAGSTIPRPPPSQPPPSPLAAGAAGLTPGELEDAGACYSFTVPESSRLWTHLAAGRAELLARLARRRFGELPRAEAEAQPLRSCPLDTRFVVREAAGSGAVGVVRTSAGEFLRRRVPGR